MLLYSKMQKNHVGCNLSIQRKSKKRKHHLHELVVSVDIVLHKRSHALETSLLVGPDCSLIKGEHKETFASPLLLDMRQHAFGEGSQSIDITQVKPL